VQRDRQPRRPVAERQLGEIQGEPVDAPDVAHAQVEVPEADHTDRSGDLVRQGALGEPRRLAGQVQVAVQRPAGDPGEGFPEVAVEEALVLVGDQVACVSQVSGGDVRVQSGDGDVALLNPRRRSGGR